MALQRWWKVSYLTLSLRADMQHKPMRYYEGSMVKVLWLASLILVGGRTTVATVAHQVTVPVPIVVSILPQKYFVERVGAPHVDVSVMVGPGQSPATYEPTPKQTAHVAHAQVYSLSSRRC
jgi:ABC-type Zn uptake system ZnuABC Zn-binding protein ZnuA